MAKKSSTSSRPEKLVRVKAQHIFSKPLYGKERAMLERLKNMPDSEIDYSDIPKLTDEQLSQFRRSPKVLVAARLDRENARLRTELETHRAAATPAPTGAPQAAGQRAIERQSALVSPNSFGS